MKSTNLIYGVGYNSRVFPTKKGTTQLKEYTLWLQMLRRCYGNTEMLSYKGCTVSDNFKNYEYCYLWCQEQVGFKVIGFALDKDLLCVSGKKLYSENTCVFIPKELNNFLALRDADRGLYKLGVSFCNREYKFVSYCNNNTGTTKFLGYFDTEIEAHNAYCIFKDSMAKILAEKHKEVISDKAYNALSNFSIRKYLGDTIYD